MTRDGSFRGSFRSTGRSEGSQRSASPSKGASGSKGWTFDEPRASTRQKYGKDQPDLSKKYSGTYDLSRMLAPALQGAAEHATKEEAKEAGRHPQAPETE
jgi:hypothetical protein